MAGFAVTDEFYRTVPKGLAENLAYRKKLIQAATRDRDLRQDLWIMCTRDPLFYLNTMVFTYDPRKTPSELPFVTFPFQDDAIRRMVEAIVEGDDLVIEKSRDMGASWCCLAVFEWFWHFRDLCTFLLVSRKESLVDERGNPDCLMAKLDFIHDRLPRWLMPETERKMLHLGNKVTGSTIDGDSTTGDVGRGGRRTAILLDEFAAVEDGNAVLSATADVTRCRIFNSTPKGTNNAHYRVVMSGTEKLRFHWSQHPEKARGLYTAEAGKLKVLDHLSALPADYQHVLDGKVRSQWYDGECRRRTNSWEIAQELDIDYLGANFQFFDAGRIEELKREHSRRPYLVGELDFTSDTIKPREFLPNAKGRLALWIHPDMAGDLPKDRQYVIGADIAMGTGSSNSCLSIGDAKTKELVGELVSPRIKPNELAKYAVALARWFNDAHLIWEANGPGRNFGDVVIESGYRNIHYRTEELSITKKKSDIPGWFSTKSNKYALISEYRQAVEAGDFINRSQESLDECNSYIVDDSGGVTHAGSTDKSDPTGARDNHGDRVISAALCFRGLKGHRPRPVAEQEAPYFSFAWRTEQARRAERQKALY